MKDADYEIKLLTQYTDFISTIEIKEEKDDDGHQNYQSDFSDLSDEEDMHSHHFMKNEAIPIILNDKGFMYYVTSFDGHCIVKQINPKDDGLD